LIKAQQSEVISLVLPKKEKLKIRIYQDNLLSALVFTVLQQSFFLSEQLGFMRYTKTLGNRRKINKLKSDLLNY
jgi:hypothetical protein